MHETHLSKRFLLLSLALLALTWMAQPDRQLSKEGRLNGAVAADPPPKYVYYFPVFFQSYPEQSSNIPLFGVNFISSVEDPADETQYANGLATGAIWNRWPLYWYSVEKSAGQFDWSAHDQLVQQDINQGLKINAILMGTPGFYVSGLSASALTEPPKVNRGFVMTDPNASTPQGINQPVFSDGSDVPAPGKSINPANKWARFVFAAVERYKPGGALAQAMNWPAGAGIRHWEMWNEQDFDDFWSSSLPDYARLLKVGYLAAKHADPNAQVLFGGLANFQKPDFLDDVLTLYDGDPLAAEHGYFFDILATHSYSRAWDSWFQVYRAGDTMSQHGLDKRIWLNETGVAAWDDYPGPMWDPDSWLRATLAEQADFTIQSTFYAVWAGAETIFHFQLYDGCGNDEAGTDPPYDPSGGHCAWYEASTGFPCAGDAFGFYSNPTDAACYTNHPSPESPRPKLAAMQLLTTHLRNVVPLERKRPGGSDPYNGPIEWIAFYRPATRERIVGLWARFGDDQTAVVPANNSSATLYASDGSSQTIYPSNGAYTIPLPGATNLNSGPDLWGAHSIGGRTYILIEKVNN